MYFAEKVAYALVGEGRVIFGEGDEEKGQGRKVGGRGHRSSAALGVGYFAGEEGLYQLPRPIIAEVEKQHGIVGLEGDRGANRSRAQKLVGDAFGVVFFHGGVRGREVFAFGGGEEPVGEAGAFPAAVSVHGIVAPDEGSYTGIRQMG
jgi:hypothetical protein